MATKLYVGNMSYQTKVDDLRALFAPYGASDVGIVHAPNGWSKGFGFVSVDDEQVERAIKDMNGSRHEGRRLLVEIARPKVERGERETRERSTSDDRNRREALDGTRRR